MRRLCGQLMIFSDHSTDHSVDNSTDSVLNTVGRLHRKKVGKKIKQLLNFQIKYKFLKV